MTVYATLLPEEASHKIENLNKDHKTTWFPKVNLRKFRKSEEEVSEAHRVEGTFPEI